MAYDFKKLSDVEAVAEPAESANVLIEEDGVIKKAPKTAVGGGGVRIVTYDYNFETEVYELDGVEIQADDIKREWFAGSILRLRHEDDSGMVISFEEHSTSDGDWITLYFVINGNLGSVNLDY